MKNHSIFMVCGALGMLMSASSLQAQKTGSITFSGAVTTPTCSADQAQTMVEISDRRPAQAAHRYACPSNNIDAAEGTTGPHYQATVQIVAQLAEPSPLLAYFADYTSGSGNPAAQLVTQTFE
jgi:type 1 fimbria pilin